MAEPVFDRNTHVGSPDAPARIVESASASTACQTNDSKFAYFLTAGVLGVLGVLAIATCLLLFAMASTSLDAAWWHSSDTYWYDDGYAYEGDWL